MNEQESPRLDEALEAAIRERYGDRPDRLAEVLANARAWERLKAGMPMIRQTGGRP